MFGKMGVDFSKGWNFFFQGLEKFRGTFSKHWKNRGEAGLSCKRGGAFVRAERVF